MKKLFTLLALIVSLALQAEPNPIVIKVLDANLEKEGEEYELVMRVIKNMNEGERLDIFLESSGTTDKVVNYLCEIIPNYKVKEKSFKMTAKIDSTQIAKFRGEYQGIFSFDMIFTNVETGVVEKIYRNGASWSKNMDTEFKFKDIGLKRGDKPGSPNYKKATDWAKKKSAGNIREQHKSIFTFISVHLNNYAPKYHYEIFPFRVNVTESVEVKKDFAKLVKINGGKELNIVPKSRLVTYTIEEKEVGGRKFERFKILGNIKYEDSADGVCDVTGRRAGKRILNALNEGQEVFASLGRAPHTKSEKLEKINLALTSNSIPGLNEEQNKLAKVRLRNAIASRDQFEILERENFERIVAEKEAQKGEEFLDKNTVDQFSSVGADMLLDVKFGQPTFHSNLTETDGVKKWFYSAKYPYHMKLLDVTTGEMISETKDFYLRNFYMPASNGQKDNAYILEKTLPSLSFDLKEFFNKAVPPSILIIEVLNDSKDKAKKVLVAGDVDSQLGAKYFVTQKSMIEVDGELLPRFETIGEITLIEEMGEGLMVGWVKEGEKEIYAAMEKDDALYVADKKGFFEKLNTFSKNMVEKYGY